MNIDFYAPGSTKNFRLFAANAIHNRFPQATLVAVHDQVNPSHVWCDVDDNEMFAEVIEYTAKLTAMYCEHLATARLLSF